MGKEFTQFDGSIPLRLLIENLRGELMKSPSVQSVKKASKSSESTTNAKWLSASLDQLHKLRDVAVSIRGK